MSMDAEEGSRAVDGGQDQAGTHHPAYTIPATALRLAGPVAKPGAGALPLRGDLAHIALAPRYLVQNYVCPVARTVGASGAPLLLHPQDGAEIVAELAGGADVELLDVVGAWAWVCKGPEGPAGFVRVAALA